MGAVDIWKRWGTQILVLMSLAFQLVLLFLAGIRRRKAHAVLRLLLWLLYQFADTTAIYAIGHLSLGVETSRAHRLVWFWAPFLLLHLGGPDTISAYALQDSQLWLRHLQFFVVQVGLASYVLGKHLRENGYFMRIANIIMFVLGVVKYAERIWALYRANLGSIRSSLKTEQVGRHHHHESVDRNLMVDPDDDDEIQLRHAHSLFHICKRAIADSWLEKDVEEHSVEELKQLRKDEDYDRVWTLMEMELSLMYDLLYTKASSIHTWRGYLVRLISSLAVAASFLLFQFSGGRDGQSILDVVVTYILLAGAFFVETASLLNALGSTWAYSFLRTTRRSWLRYKLLCTGKWDRLRWFVKTGKGMIGRRGINKRSSARRWPGMMGQYNMLHFCSRRERAYRPLLGRVFTVFAPLEDWWNTYHYSGTVAITHKLRELLLPYVKELSKSELNALGVIRKNWGRHALDTFSKTHALDLDNVMLYDELNSDKHRWLGVEFQECIIIWHIGTEVFLSQSQSAGANKALVLVEAIRTLSNYMMFLLVDRPYMLPGLGQSMLYRRTCENLTEMWRERDKNKEKEYSQEKIVPGRPKENMLKEILFRLHDGPSPRVTDVQLSHIDELAKLLYDEKPDYEHSSPRLTYAYKIALVLLDIEDKTKKDSTAVIELLLRVWMDFLVYAANRCSRESHAKTLGSGGELITVVWIMMDYFNQETYYMRSSDKKFAPKAP